MKKQPTPRQPTIILSERLEKSPLWRSVRQKLLEMGLAEDVSIVVDEAPYPIPHVKAFGNDREVIVLYPNAMADDFAATVIAEDIRMTADTAIVGGGLMKAEGMKGSNASRLRPTGEQAGG